MNSEHIKSLHGLRGLAAITVLIGHYRIIRGEPGLGVVLFFVLSGFLIGRLYLEKPFDLRNAASYLVARFARIYPLFAFVVISVGLINYLDPAANIFEMPPTQVPEHLLLAGSAKTIWTICAEFQFYFLFVALWWARQFVKSPLYLLVPAIGAFGLWALLLGNDAQRTDITTYLHVFLIGTFIAAITRDGSDSWQRLSKLAFPFALAGFAFIYLFATSFHGSRTIYIDPIALAACAGLVFCAVKAGETPLNKLLSLPLAHWLGEISFGIYLFHRQMAWLVEQVFGISERWVAVPLQILLTLACAQTAYWVIEQPCRTRLRSLGAVLLDRKMATSP